MTTAPEPTALIDAGDGVHLHPDEVAAAYRLGAADTAWVDMPEARPRVRARTEVDVTIVIDTTGQLHHPECDGLEVDAYVDPDDDPGRYADVRAEGEARWAAHDARATPGPSRPADDDRVRPELTPGPATTRPARDQGPGGDHE